VSLAEETLTGSDVLKEILVKERWAGEVEAGFGHPAKLREGAIDSPERERFTWFLLFEAGLGSAVAITCSVRCSATATPHR
jgi:hypothetical protein